MPTHDMKVRLGDPLAKAKPERTWPTQGELAQFLHLRETGQLSFYREGKCEKCGTVIPKAKKFCTGKCAGVDVAPKPSDDDDDFYEED